MNRYESGKVELPPISPDAESADLIFYGIDRTGPSYEARVFVGNPDATLETPRELGEGYVGSFTIFGHGGCVGEAGHCDPTGPQDEYDLRLGVGLSRLTRVVPISKEALKRLSAGDFSITVVPVVPGERVAELTDTLDFEGWRLASYE